MPEGHLWQGCGLQVGKDSLEFQRPRVFLLQSPPTLVNAIFPLILLGWGTLHGVLLATPDRATQVRERILGSNPNSFAILREESDNLGNYYTSRKTVWLDEVPKIAGGREKTKSTLLLDVTYHVDPDHADPNIPPAVTEELHTRDSELTLAAILQSNSDQPETRWTPEQRAQLVLHPVGGVRLGHRLVLVDGAFIQQKVFGGRDGASTWRLDEVTEDGNCLYVSLSIGEDGSAESRVVCVPPDVTKRFQDQKSAEPVYLVAGQFESRESAAELATALVAKARAEKIFGFRAEIWAVDGGWKSFKYVVVDAYSTDRIREGGIDKLEESLGVRFTPTSSERFVERFFVAN
jgi:hypothetical protein